MLWLASKQWLWTLCLLYTYHSFCCLAQSWEDDSNQTEHWTQQYQIKHRPDQMILYRPLYWGRWCYHHHLGTSRLIKLRLTLWVRLMAFHFIRIVLVSSCKSADQNICKANHFCNFINTLSVDNCHVCPGYEVLLNTKFTSMWKSIPRYIISEIPGIIQSLKV